MDAMTALGLYRNKGLLEKSFGNFKDCLNLCASWYNLGRGLTENSLSNFWPSYTCLISKKHMQEAMVYQKYTSQSVLDKNDIIECLEYPSYDLRVVAILTKQK